ncbi:MAG TPA: hypothetical protein VGD80_14260 [Kofleriaceae bacterium]
MMRRNHPHTAITTISLSLLLAIALPAGAEADDAAKRDGPTPGSTRLASTAEPAAPDPGPGASTATTATTGDAAAPAARYPRSVIARPLTLPAGLAMLGADASANHDFSSMGGAPIVGYGFTDDIEIQIPYAFATKDFEIKGTLNGDLGYKLLRGAAGGKLEAIARVRGGYNLLDSAAAPLMLGVHVQYNITDTIAVISGTPGSQQLRISLADDAAMTRPIDLSLPLGVGYQPTEQLYLQLDTKLVQLDLHDSANAVIGADMTPVALTVVYNALPALDVQAVLSTDLSNSPGDALSFLVGARYYAGKL